MSDNLSHLAGRKGLKQNMFQDLIEQTKSKGKLSEEDMRNLAEEYLIGNANVYGTASFYDFLKKENQNKKVYVCSGSTCLLAGTQDKLKDNLKKTFKEEEIGHMCCLGRCHENNAFHYDGVNYSAQSDKAIEDILAKKTKDGIDNYSVATNIENPVLTAPFTNVDEYYQLFKEALKKDRLELLQEIKESGIRGRGGAGFPMGFKWESCMNTEASQKFIVCNADEGDPGAYSDRYLLEKQTHAVLLGMMIAGYITGANRGALYIRAEYPESVTIVKEAINELEQKGLNGENIEGSGFDFRFKVIEGAGAYICGEETALLNSIEGQRAEVRIRPPFPTQAGLFNKPTVVNNVETLASVPFILKNGGKAYAKLGTGKSSGTKLVSLDSFFNKPGIYEIEMGTPLSTIINDFGGGFKSDIKALHIGGPLGGIVPMSKIDDPIGAGLNLDFESFSENGFLLGHAGIVCIPKDFPMIKYLEHLFEFTADESCGKCFPCSLGSTRGKEMIQKAQHEDFKIDKKLLDDLLETMEIGSLCALGGGLPLGIKNALQYFGDELNEFINE